MTTDWLRLAHDHEDKTGQTAEDLALWVNVIIRIQLQTGISDTDLARIVQSAIDSEA